VKPITKPIPESRNSHRFDPETWHAFELGREWKLSLAEIETLFGAENIVSVTPKLCVVQTSRDVAQIASRMGGIIRAFQMDAPLRDPRSFGAEVGKRIGRIPNEARITFGLGAIGVSVPIFSQ
jgi:hypothetical protein